MKTIVIVTPYFAPAWSYGGPPKVLYTLAKELVKLGKKLIVITTDAHDEKRNPVFHEIIDGIEIYRYKTISNTVAYKGKVFYSPFLLSKTKNILQQADCVLFSDLRSILNWQIYSFIERNNIPYGIFPFGQTQYPAGFKTIVKKIFDYVWVNDFVIKAHWRFYQTDHEKNLLMNFFHLEKDQTHFLPLPVDAIKRIKGTHQNKKLQFSKSDKIILFVGRLNKLKGVDILIDSVIPLIQKDKLIKLIIVGRDDGVEQELKKMIAKEIRGAIIFTGPLYGEDISRLYSRATCFVITPRYYEETSLASLEALSYGVPVVATRESDIPFLEKYKAGLITDNNSHAIQKSIKKVLHRMDKDREGLRRQAIKLIKEHFDSSIVSQRFVACINKS